VLVGWYLPFQLPVMSIAVLVLVTLVISVAAGLIPARRAASMVVRDALSLK
jgi:ABC-type antimicrobial peptide transport system permease subunit